MLFACGLQLGALADRRRRCLRSMFGARSMSARPACAKASSIRSRVAAMAEIGVDISRHKPITFEELDEWEGSIST